jgi:membrane-associated phospholipid phosphatase
MRWKPATAIVPPMNGIVRLRVGTDRAARCPASLAFPWAPVFALIAVVVTAVIGALVWNPRRPSGVDTWAAKVLTVSDHSFPYRLASRLDDTMRVLPVLAGSVAIASVSWVMLRRRDAVVASLVVAPATVAVELLVKLAGRRSLGLDSFTYPSGRAALAASLVLLLVLVLRAAAVRSVVRATVAVFGTAYVLSMAWARVATGQHVLTDAVGGVSMGVAVTLAAVLALRAWGNRVPMPDQQHLAHTVPPGRSFRSSRGDHEAKRSEQ